jgi:hypothetical protein
MRILLVVLALTMSIALPPTSSAAQDQPPVRPAARVAEPFLASQLPTLLRTLGVELIPRAHAAECTAEGETCTSKEQCCPGLECSGGPPATCVEED